MRLLALVAMVAGSVFFALLIWSSVAQQAGELYGFFGWWGILILVAPGTIISTIAFLSQ